MTPMMSAVSQVPPTMAADWTIAQDWAGYTAEEHARWDQLYARQTQVLAGRVVPEFFEGLARLHLDRPGIPDFDALSERLMEATGWRVVAVPGIVPDRVFFEHLAQRRFVAGRFLRGADQIDYLQEPDVFHDIFGHVPLLAHPVFADYLQAYGEGGLRAERLGALDHLARLYWYTVEFGLMRHGEELRIFGAGLASSFSEAQHALGSASARRLAFALPRVMRTRYCSDCFQRSYFVIESFEDLLQQTLATDFAPLYAALEQLPDLDPDEIHTGDCVC